MEFAIQRKNQNIPFTVGRAGNNGVHLTDNRLLGTTQKKMYSGSTSAPVQLMAASNAVVQMVSDEQLDAMVNDIKNNNKEGFKAKFRAAAPGMDEEISCQVTFDHARKLLPDTNAIKTFLTRSDSIRLPTGVTAHYVNLPNGVESRLVHPTAHSEMMYGALYNNNGNPRWVNHTSFDRERAEYVKNGTSIDEMADRAIEFTLGSGAQPPFAKNSMTALLPDEDQAHNAHILREKHKARHSRFDPTKTQPYDAPWYPDKSKRGVSPVRVFPKKE